MKDRIKKLFTRYQYGLLLCSYIFICVLIVVLCYQRVRTMVNDYNKEQVELVTSLLVENVNSELNSTIVQVERVANVVLLSSNEENKIIQGLENYKRLSGLTSIGYIDENNEFHGNSAEKRDLVKHDILQQAISLDSTFITDPYRSSITGKYTLTIFVPVFDGSNKVGVAYANLDLDEIAKFANRNDMNLSANICMINSKSLNYIACTDMEGVPAGSWYSLMLKREDLEFKSSDGYYEFMNSIRHDDEGTVCFSVGKTEYTLGYSSIEKMPNWYIALELVNDDLSDSFKRFRSIVYGFMILLLFITVVYAAFIIIKELVQRKNFQKLSTIDAMTGLYNKRTFERYVEEYITSKSGRRFGTLIFVDVDDFKHYNDKYGHLNGDIVLKTFAKCLSEQFSKIGYVGRYGGDEFVAFITGEYDKSYIENKIKEISMSLSSVELEGYGNVPVSFSAGGANYPSDGTDYKELCDSADEALYQVKESGKNKFYWHQ